MTAAVEVGAIRWVTVTTSPVEEQWIETSSREPSTTVTTTKKGELELIPV
jgi:hypothetical protein